MPADHPWVNCSTAATLCCAVDSAGEEMPRSPRLLETACHEKGIYPWVDIWGGDVHHDWEWWRRQLPYFLGKLLD